MKQKFGIRVRQYATGEIVATSHHEIENEHMSIDDIVLNYDIGDAESEASGEEIAFREFDLVLSATPPPRGAQIDVAVDVADGATEVAVDVPDPVPA